MGLPPARPLAQSSGRGPAFSVRVCDGTAGLHPTGCDCPCPFQIRVQSAIAMNACSNICPLRWWQATGIIPASECSKTCAFLATESAKKETRNENQTSSSHSSAVRLHTGLRSFSSNPVQCSWTNKSGSDGYHYHRTNRRPTKRSRASGGRSHVHTQERRLLSSKG